MKISKKNIRLSLQGTILAGLIAQLETPTSCSNKTKQKKSKPEYVIQSPHNFCVISQACLFQDILLIKKWWFPIFINKEF